MAEFISENSDNEPKAPKITRDARLALGTYAVLEIARDVFNIGSGLTKVRFIHFYTYSSILKNYLAA